MKQKNRNITKPCVLDMTAPIDLVKLKEETETKGELRCRFDYEPYEVLVNAYKCPCDDRDCQNIVVNVQRKNGLFVTLWSLTQEDFDEFTSFQNFFNYIINLGYISSDGERQLIENEAKKVFGENFLADAKPPCICGGCIKQMGEKEFWKKKILYELTDKLCERENAFMKGQEKYGDEIRNLLDYVYDIGFSTARTYSEYVGRIKIEPHALMGISYEALQKKRTHESGKKSTENRLERIKHLLLHMEQLAKKNPDILRIGSTELALIAYEDAQKENPELWVQGYGQIGEYIGLVRRGEVGEELKNRYLKMFPKQLKKQGRII